jgi:hypothetical protein
MCVYCPSTGCVAEIQGRLVSLPFWGIAIIPRGSSSDDLYRNLKAIVTFELEDEQWAEALYQYHIEHGLEANSVGMLASLPYQQGCLNNGRTHPWQDHGTSFRQHEGEDEDAKIQEIVQALESGIILKATFVSLSQ